MKLNIKFKVRNKVFESYVSDPKPSVESLTKVIHMIATTPNLIQVELLNESNI